MLKGSKVKERSNFKHAQVIVKGSKVKERSNFTKYRRNVRLCSDLFTDLVLYTVAVCDCVFHLYDFFLLLLLLLLTQPQSATVYFFCTISSSSSSYTVAVCDCVFHLYDFFLLLLSSSVNTSLTNISDIIWPILTRLGHKYRLTTPFMSHDQIRVKGTYGSQGSKRSFSLKMLLLLQTI